MPLERSVLFAALWLTEQGRWGLKHPVQQEIYGFLGFKLHLWSRFMDIFQWCYCKGVATAALELMRTGQSKSAQPCTGIFQGPSHKHRPEPLCASSVALCWVQFSPAQGLSQPLPLSKSCQTAEQAGLLWDTWHLYAAAERMTEAQQTSSQLYADAMAHCIRSNTQGCHGLTKAFLQQSLANGSQKRKIQHG